jgi:hypothetical protein
MTMNQNQNEMRMCSNQPAQIDCRVSSCRFYQGAGKCSHLSPQLTLNEDNSFVCWTKIEAKKPLLFAVIGGNFKSITLPPLERTLELVNEFKAQLPKESIDLFNQTIPIGLHTTAMKDLPKGKKRKGGNNRKRKPHKKARNGKS